MPVAFNMDSWTSAIRALRNGSVMELLALCESGAVSKSQATDTIAARWYENPWQGVELLHQLRQYPGEAAGLIAAQVETLSLPTPGRRWTETASLWFFSPRARLTWSLASVVLLQVLVGLHWLARLEGRQSFLAPTSFDLWLSIGLGALVGAIGAAWERFLFTHRSDDQIAFYRIPFKERPKSPYFWKGLWQSGWLLILMFGLIGWCALTGVFVLPAILATNAVQFASNLRIVTRFRAELESS